MHDVAITGGQCFVKGQFVEANIGIDGNRISYIGKEDVRGEIEISASGKFVLPGMFNTHTHAAMTLFRGYAEGLELKEWLERIWEIEAKLDEKAVYWGSLLACLEMLKSGITAFADMYIHMDAVAKAVGESGIRAFVGYGMADRGDSERGKKELRMAKNLLKWNGSFGGRLKCMLTPHAPYTCSPEFLKEVSELSRETGLIKHIHLSETLWEVMEIRRRYGLRPAELLESIGFLDDKVVVAHAVWLTDREIKLLARRRVSVAHCPSSNLKLSSGIARVAEMLELGVNVSIATDGAASNNMLNLFQELRLAALLQNLRKKPLSSAVWLKVATENGYKAYGMFGGSLERGALADVVTVEKSVRYRPVHDPTSSIVFASTGCEVSDVIVDGKLLLEEGIPLSLDEERVTKKAEGVAKKLVEYREKF